MPPRHAYWTILVDEQPTAFRAALLEDLQPTFKRLKEKHPSARVVWFQNGKVWNSREDAQAAMRARGEMGRKGDVRQRFGDRTREPRPEQSDRRDPSGKLEWKPKGEATPRPRPEWRPKSSSPPRAPGFSRGRPEAREKLAWKPKSASGTTQDPRPRTQDPKRRGAQREGRPEWRPKGGTTERPKLDWKPKGAPGTTQDSRPRTQDPRRQREGGPEKRKWIPKEEYKKSQGSKPKARDKNWRPGGAHQDPRQKYKDAKKAKWTRFKQTIRKRWESKDTRKKKDDE
jgi:hypothetical protein